ncbi:unnamed protein product [Trichobilharzia regenti]|nr:unnamed protein product [Trichobilharzia regenti]
MSDQKNLASPFNAAFDNTMITETENDDIWGQLEYMHTTLSKFTFYSLSRPQTIPFIIYFTTD